MLRLAKILGTAALAGTLVACSAIVSFDNAKLFEGDTAQTIRGLLAKPSGDGPFPAVVLLHGCGGLRSRSNVIEDWTNFLTSLGYVTLWVDSLGPRGLNTCVNIAGDWRELSRDAYGALDYLASLPFVNKERIGVMGFSMGGLTIGYFSGQGFKTSSGVDFKAAVGVYTGCGYLRKYSKIIPTAVIIGELEDEKHLLPCKTLAGQSPPFPSVKVHVLPNTHHGFDQRELTTLRPDPFGNLMLYSWEATKKAREITEAFLAERLGQWRVP